MMHRGDLRGEKNPCRAVRCSHRESISTCGTDQFSIVELERRFQELSEVLQKARDSFSCRLEEEQQNPLKELRTRLLKAKERFQSRLASASRFPDPGGFYPMDPENPFQELRSVLKSARVNFIPLLDQYILDNSSHGWVSDYSQSEPPNTGSKPRPFSGETPPKNLNFDDDDDDSPSRLHWLLEEETRCRRRKNFSSTGPEAEDGFKYATATTTSPAERLDSLISEELNRKRDRL